MDSSSRTISEQPETVLDHSIVETDTFGSVNAIEVPSTTVPPSAQTMSEQAETVLDHSTVETANTMHVLTDKGSTEFLSTAVATPALLGVQFEKLKMEGSENVIDHKEAAVEDQSKSLPVPVDLLVRTEPSLSDSPPASTENLSRRTNCRHRRSNNRLAIHSFIPEASKTLPGSSLNLSATTENLPKSPKSLTGPTESRQRPSGNRPSTSSGACGHELNSSKDEASTASSGSNSPPSKIIPPCIIVRHAGERESAIMEDYNDKIWDTTMELPKYRKAVKGAKNFALESRVRYLRLRIEKPHLSGLQEEFNEHLCKLKNISAELDPIIGDVENRLNSCSDIARKINRICADNKPPESSYLKDRFRYYIQELDENMKSLTFVIRKAKYKYKEYLKIRSLIILYFELN